MKRLMIVETRDPIATPDAAWGTGLLIEARQAGTACTLMLAENGTLGARAGASPSWLVAAADAGIEILADAFALAERGIPAEQIATGIRSAPLALIVDRLAAGDPVLWR
ncbi:hypothetical protein [Sphingosinicella terrae]|uniref:hypothetical protein n=1 Tax=Sphingosinicella terrae TaxID=2172047 RepID=UPI000E0D826B|nr:hypothetical protein [Sphingosinicella terrae]